MAHPVPADSLRQELEQLMDQDEFEQALKRLKDYLSEIESPMRDAVGQQTARYNRLRKDIVNNRIDAEDADVTRAQIRTAVLGIFDLAMEDQALAIPSGLADVSVPEEVRLEELIGVNNLQSIAWLEQGLNMARSVCRVVTPSGGVGTGFLVAPGVIMTNNHVIPDTEVAAGSSVEFNYQQTIEGVLLPKHRYSLNPDHFHTSPRQLLDYTIVGVRSEPSEPVLDTWGSLRLDPHANPVPSEHVVIIQHPSGGPKQIALTANQVVQTIEYRLHYTTDTMPGSSGAPVFNQRWEVVALHRGSVGLKPNARGDKRFVNEGILLSAIKADAGDMWPA